MSGLVARIISLCPSQEIEIALRMSAISSGFLISRIFLKIFPRRKLSLLSEGNENFDLNCSVRSYKSQLSVLSSVTPGGNAIYKTFAKSDALRLRSLKDEAYFTFAMPVMADACEVLKSLPFHVS